MRALWRVILFVGMLVAEARANLLASKEGLEGEAAKAAIDDLDQLLGRVVGNLSTFLPLITQHRHWNNRFLSLAKQRTALPSVSKLQLTTGA